MKTLRPSHSRGFSSSLSNYYLTSLSNSDLFCLLLLEVLGDSILTESHKVGVNLPSLIFKFPECIIPLAVLLFTDLVFLNLAHVF